MGRKHGIRAPRNKILGQELSGEIESIGTDVIPFKKGDQVFGRTGLGLGAYAEYICLPEDAVLAIKPHNMTYEEAAAVPFGGLDALHFIKKANIHNTPKVLINGASGSIGTFAVQIAKYFGAEVTGVCSTTNLELVKSLGASQVIDYTREDFTQSATIYDVIFDAVGKLPPEQGRKMLKRGGVYISVNADSDGGDNLNNLLLLKELIEAGRLKPVIDRVYSLEQIVEAHRYVDSGDKKGNVVITVGHSQ